MKMGVFSVYKTMTNTIYYPLIPQKSPILLIGI